MACLLIMIAVRWSGPIVFLVLKNVREEKNWEAIPLDFPYYMIFPGGRFFFRISHFAP
jgi:hypothetical protein